MLDDETLGMAKDIANTHHERWDGTGYPRAIAFIVGGQGTQFDPAVVDAFVGVAGTFKVVSGR